MKHILFFIFLFFISSKSFSQDVYKTPSGERYHLSSCRMVENVSSKLVGIETINSSKLTPCKICKPPPKSQLQKRLTGEDKSVGTSETVRCKGFTQKGTRCKHRTRLANGYCYQHTKQHSKSPSATKYIPSETTSTLCGAKTKSGKPCKRKVKGGGFCYQHS